MRFAFIAAEKAQHSVGILCRCLQVTRSGFYAWATRGPSARAQRDVVLRTKLRAFHTASGHRYGRPNLCAHSTHRDQSVHGIVITQSSAS